ncbi:unnamed protein product [Rhizophagus irregularis]|uniref:Uncharacterized protein n=1 Tax=Rhizophagus irregularis TaxID=588596 RepID=A0A915ZYZ3_9GLOM|nr:unnamed protein product [Rhizophagus irregularis]CAB5198596.1 unnamed protein product [Rhizophagus irregularis]CAB5392533.1 unnamed protein product [Rhizophagus irregularis]
MGCLLKSFVKILQTAKLSKLSKQSKSSEPSKLSMPSSFNPLDTRTLREILDHTPPQNLQDEVAKYVLRKNWNIYVSLRDKHHKEMMESLGQKQHLINAHSLESALYRLK